MNLFRNDNKMQTGKLQNTKCSVIWLKSGRLCFEVRYMLAGYTGTEFLKMENFLLTPEFGLFCCIGWQPLI